MEATLAAVVVFLCLGGAVARPPATTRRDVPSNTGHRDVHWPTNHVTAAKSAVNKLFELLSEEEFTEKAEPSFSTSHSQLMSEMRATSPATGIESLAFQSSITQQMEVFLEVLRAVTRKNPTCGFTPNSNREISEEIDTLKQAMQDLRARLIAHCNAVHSDVSCRPRVVSPDLPDANTDTACEDLGAVVMLLREKLNPLPGGRQKRHRRKGNRKNRKPSPEDDKSTTDLDTIDADDNEDDEEDEEGPSGLVKVDGDSGENSNQLDVKRAPKGTDDDSELEAKGKAGRKNRKGRKGKKGRKGGKRRKGRKGGKGRKGRKGRKGKKGRRGNKGRNRKNRKSRGNKVRENLTTVPPSSVE